MSCLTLALAGPERGREEHTLEDLFEEFGTWSTDIRAQVKLEVKAGLLTAGRHMNTPVIGWSEKT